jgi:hypothetical protein
MQLAFRCRAVGMCASKQSTEQKRSFMRPELQELTEHR